MDLNKVWSNNKGKIIGWVLGLILTSGGSYGLYVLNAVKSFEKSKEEAKLTILIKKVLKESLQEELTDPENLAVMLMDSNVIKAQTIREDKILKKALKDAVQNKPPDSLKLSKRLIYTMDLKRSQNVEDEIAKMYVFYKDLRKNIVRKQGKPINIKL